MWCGLLWTPSPEAAGSPSGVWCVECGYCGVCSGLALLDAICVKVEGQCWECEYKGNECLKVHLAGSKTCGLKAESTIVKRSSVLVQSGNPLSIAGP